MLIQSIRQETILKELRTKSLGRSLVVVETCSSTNDLASKFALDGAPHGLTVIAEQQTTGRGRFGRSWISPRGGIWFTVLLRDALSVDICSGLPLTGALAVARTLDSRLRVRARVRWPNDVVVDSRKVAGILVETKSKGNELDYALLGIGINANFPASMITSSNSRAVSLLDLVGSHSDRESVISSTLLEIEYLNELLASKHSESVIGLLEKFDYSVGKGVSVKLKRGEIFGIFNGYLDLSKVRIATGEGSIESVDTSEVISADYVN